MLGHITHRGAPAPTTTHQEQSMSTIPEPEQTPDGPAFEGRLLTRPDEEVVDQGVAFDLGTLLTRRRVLAVVGAGVGSLALAACSSGSGTSAADSSTSATTSGAASGSSSASTATGEIPQETNGPYPADGTNGVNVLQESGIVRSDITSSLGGGAVAAGVPLSFTFTLTDTVNSKPFEGAALYVWHCDADGKYSMYSEGLEDVTYLRGVQVADSDGSLTFTTIMPGCYAGRWTHLHFEVYTDEASATNGSNAIATSQVAFPQDVLDDVYALDTYPSSASNLARLSLDSDMVFSDGYDLQMGTFAGSPSKGYTGSLAVAIDTSTEASMGGGGGMGGGMGGGTGGTPPAPPSN